MSFSCIIITYLRTFTTPCKTYYAQSPTIISHSPAIDTEESKRCRVRKGSLEQKCHIFIQYYITDAYTYASGWEVAWCCLKSYLDLFLTHLLTLRAFIAAVSISLFFFFLFFSLLTSTRKSC